MAVVKAVTSREDGVNECCEAEGVKVMSACLCYVHDPRSEMRRPNGWLLRWLMAAAPAAAAAMTPRRAATAAPAVD